MTRVLMVSHWDWVLYNYRLPVARALRDQGCEVTFVCPYGEYTERLKGTGFPWVPWKIRRRSLNPWWEAAALAHLVGIYRRLAPDAVHHFTIKPNFYGTIAARLTRIPIIINTFTGLGYVFSGNGKARWLRTMLIPAMRAVMGGRNTTAILQNPQDLQTLTNLGVFSKGQAEVIAGSSVDIHRFKPVKKCLPQNDGATPEEIPTVILAARLLWDKGVGEFVEAARQIKGKGVKARFQVAGAPDKGNPGCIEDQHLKQWVNEGVVEFLGHREDMPELLQAAQVAALPTYYPEGLPRFLLEAAATGLPLIATDIDGCRMVVQEGINGFLIPTRDAEALSTVILSLLADKDLQDRLGQAARDMAVREFSEEKIIGQYLDLYRRIGVVDGI